MSDLFPKPTAPTTQRMAYTMKEAAQAIGLCEKTIYTLIREGYLRAKRIGNRSVRITADDLAAYLDNLPSVESVDADAGDDGEVSHAD